MLHDILRNKFGFESFKPGQQEIIESIMSQQHTSRYSSNWKRKEFVLSNTYVFIR